MSPLATPNATGVAPPRVSCPRMPNTLAPSSTPPSAVWVTPCLSSTSARATSKSSTFRNLWITSPIVSTPSGASPHRMAATTSSSERFSPMATATTNRTLPSAPVAAMKRTAPITSITPVTAATANTARLSCVPPPPISRHGRRTSYGSSMARISAIHRMISVIRRCSWPTMASTTWSSPPIPPVAATPSLRSSRPAT